MQERKFIPLAHPVLSGNEKKYVEECLETTWISSIGKFLPLFEERFAEFCGVEHAVSCNNGTAALHLALLGLGVRPGDEVIVPTLTFVATANAVRYCSATPVFVDSEPGTMNIDPAKIEAKITDRTKGIIAVHLYGHPAEMDPILQLARERGLFVLEDAAEAHGAEWRGRKVGSIGDAAVFSFFGNKIITTGEGGMVTTRDSTLADRIRLLRGQGMDPKRRYWFPIVGYNYRMTNIQAAMGLAQTERLPEHLEARRRVAGWYHEYLADCSEFVNLPQERKWARHAFWMYTILLGDSATLERDECMARLLDAGIETRPVFYPMHVLPPYRELDGLYPVAEGLSRRGISLPTHGLLTRNDVEYIAGCVRSLFREGRVQDSSGSSA
jgi:perosamine synthetase